MTLHLRGGAVGIAVIVALTGCSGGDDQATETTPSEPQMIAVTVTDGDTGSPVPNATVKAFDGDSTNPTKVTSNAKGIARVPLNTSRVRVEHSRFTVGKAHLVEKPVTITVWRPDRQSPEYGGGPQRTRYLPAVNLAAPKTGTKPAWTFDARTLIEFPPAVRHGIAVFGVNSGRVFALNVATGKVRWQTRMGGPIASTPAIAGPRAYVTDMNGKFTAFRISDGKRTFQFDAASPIESSPLIIDDLAYFGNWKGTLYALNLRTGKPRWTFQAGSDIKGSAVHAGNKVVFGDYAGNVYALNARTGARVWTYSGGKRFYGGPGFSNGTIVIGDVGGATIAINADTGREIWRHSSRGQYVYASPAIANGVVYIGDYGGRFQALNLRTGAVKWTFNAGGRISGSATVVGDVVYTSVLTRPGEPKRTFGLKTSNGAKVFQKDDGRYSPAVGAGNTLLLVGTRHLYAYPTNP